MGIGRVPFAEPNRHSEAAARKCVCIGMYGEHLVEHVTWKEHNAIINWRERCVCRGSRVAGRRDPSIIHSEFPAAEATGTRVKIIDT